jgi:drug/metabolite transporter (DMT)-like permease
MILLIANKQVHPILLLALFGVFLLVSHDPAPLLEYEQLSTLPADNGNRPNHPSYEGFIMILLAALTEAAIYFLVRDIKTTNNWNHVFISYFLGAVLLSAYFFVNKFASAPSLHGEDSLGAIFKSISESNRLTFSLIVNAVIGLFGYLLRFFAITHLDTYLYAVLSYFGIVMAFIYGIFD